MTDNVHELSVSDLTRLLAVASDKEVAEFNAIYDELDAANAKIAELEKANAAYKVMEGSYKVLKDQSDTILKNGETHLNVAKQARREMEQMKDKLNTAEELLKAYKVLGTPKKLREKIKSYQTKAAENLKVIAGAKETVKDYRREIDKQILHNKQLEDAETTSNMTSVWNEDGDNLMLFPSRLTMQMGTVEERQLTLLFMTKSGCGKLIALDEDGNPAECTLPEEGLSPKPRTLEVAGSILRRWRRKGWKIDVADLDLGSM